MSQRFTHIEPQGPVRYTTTSPVVEGVFALDPRQVAYCAQPIKMIGMAALSLIGLGLIAAAFGMDQSIMIVLTSSVCAFGSFYIVGQLMLYRYLHQEQSKRIELDEETKLLHYQSLKEQLLFQREQVILCVWKRSLLFPYRVDEVCIHLEGGKEISCSNLLIEPRDLLLWLKAPLVREYKWFM